MNKTIDGFVRGLRYPLDGLVFIHRHGLWALAAMSIAVNVLLFGGFVLAFWLLAGPWLRWAVGGLFRWVTGLDFEAIGLLVIVICVLFGLLAGLLTLGLVALTVLLIGRAVASPILDKLSERVERIVLEEPEEPLSVPAVLKSLALGLAALVRSLLLFVVVHIPILLIGVVVPAVGTLPSSIASFCFVALLLAVEFIGLSMTRRHMSYLQRCREIWRNRSVSLGFGSSAAFLVLVPGLNLIFLPLAAVGGTLAFCQFHRDGRLEVVAQNDGRAA